jgi:hypothetical protein
MATQPLLFSVYKQARGAKKITVQNATDLQLISLTKPLERDENQALKRYSARCSRLATYFYRNLPV